MKTAAPNVPTVPPPMRNSTNLWTGHIPALDGVRGLAILMVMLHHNTVFEARFGLERWFHFLTGLGTAGVDLFFVLSGFLITGILIDSKGYPRYFTNFYARRTVRIFPLYYAVLIVSLVILPVVMPWIAHAVASPAVVEAITQKINRFGSIAGHEWWFWLYLSNVPVAMTGTWLHGILGVSWSLAIEEQFYLCWPLVVRFVSRAMAMRVCVALIVLALVSRVALWIVFARTGTTLNSVPFANPLGIYVLTFCRVDGLAVGALLAYLLRGAVDLDRLKALARRTLVLGAPLVVTIALVESQLGLSDPTIGPNFGPVYQTIGFSIGNFVFASLLLLAITARVGGVWRGVWTSSLMTTLGKYAYALYFFHLPLRAVVRDTLFGPAQYGARFKFPVIMGSEFVGQLLFYVTTIGVALGAAWLSWNLFEKHFLKLKRYFPSGGERTA